MNNILLFINILKKKYTFIIMSTHIQNYGFTKTFIKDNNNNLQNEVKWIGDYDGDKANIQLDINDNGDKKLVSMQLDNNDIMNLLGIQPVKMSLDNRLTNDFLNTPIILEGALLTKRKTRKHYKKHNSRKHSRRRKKHNSRKHRYRHKI
jgi:hypothetical protein